ncbi:YARHG domain-containing protein [uncultured Draconibacterium sp.]|uniref:YARHG domain-containing protein n=1 Tax=uncultured Draconibacterium sp. TaxID=1573823 RepID=UPI0029C97413|nr:YARHG domain-containing protein [uncultured Draconibacterium sp.]
MKYILIPLLIISLIACKKSKRAESALKNADVKIYSKTIEEPNKVIDTCSFEYFITKTDNYGEIPKYLVDSFIGEEWYNTNDAYQAFYGDNENKHYCLNGNKIITFQITSFGVCSDTYLSTYNSRGKMISNLIVGGNCDADLSSAHYSFNYFSIYSDSLVETYKKTIQAVDYKHTLPDSIESLDDVETKEIIECKQYIIKTNGIIEKQRKTKNILNRDELMNLDIQSLRIMRNEFFARYGYKFKSKDLNDYFSQIEWYSPKYDDVSDKLSAFEIYNISLIKEVESEKNDK